MVFIRSLRFAGLYSYVEENEIILSNRTVLVGPNNSGKSNIMRVIKLLVDTFNTGKRLGESEISHMGDNPFLEIKFTLSPQETEKIIDFMSFFPNTQNRSSQFRDLKNREFLKKNLDVITIKLLWQKEIHEYGSEPFVEIYFEKINMWGCSNYFSGSFPVSNRLLGVLGGYPLRNDLFLCDILGQLTGNESDRAVLAKLSPTEQGSYISVETVRYGNDVNMDNKGKSMIQNLYSYMGYHIQSNQEISFRSLLGTILKRALCYASGKVSTDDILDVAESLRTFDTQDGFDKKLMDQATSLILARTTELSSDGSNLSQFLFHMMVSENFADKEKFENIRTAFNDILKVDELSIDISLEYYPLQRAVNFLGQNEPVIPKRPIILITDRKLGKSLPLKQVGAGLAEIIYLLSASYGMKNSVILLDEPSVNLHPSLMKSLMRYIGRSENQNQFIIITHSAELTQYELFESNADIMYVRKSNQRSKITSLKNETKEWFDENRSKFKHQIDSRIFFGRCIILTEGESDKNLLGIASYLNSQDPSMDLENNDIAIVSIGGSCNFNKYRKFLDGFQIPYVILADSDAKRLFPSSGTINKEGISGSDHIFLIDGGDLEQFMRDIDIDAYTKADKEFSGSKPSIAYEFAKIVSTKNPDALKPIKLFLQQAIKRSK